MAHPVGSANAKVVDNRVDQSTSQNQSPRSSYDPARSTITSLSEAQEENRDFDPSEFKAAYARLAADEERIYRDKKPLFICAKIDKAIDP